MAKIGLDSLKNVVVISEGSMIIITAYSEKLKAVKAAVSYLPSRRMASEMKIIFENEKEIIDKLKVAGKIHASVANPKIENICLFYCSQKLVISKHESLSEILHKFLRAEQG